MCYLYLSAIYLRVEESLDRQPTVSDHCLLQGGRSLADPVPLVLDGVFLHPSLETLLQPTVATLVPLVLVHGAAPGEPAAVGVLLPNAPPEESLTAVAGGGPVVFSRGSVSTDSTVLGEYRGALSTDRLVTCLSELSIDLTWLVVHWTSGE